MDFFDAAATAGLLDYAALIADLRRVLAEHARGEVVSPERLVVPCGDGGGLLLSMPAHASDLLAHKLVTVYGGNRAGGLPTVQGQVTCLDARDGTPLFSLDGPTVTARRTAALIILGIQLLRPAAPERVLVIGTGALAEALVAGLRQTFAGTTILVRGRSPDRADAFRARLGSPAGVVSAGSDGVEADVVIAATTSTEPVYDEAPVPDRLVVGAGAFRLTMVEIGGRTIRGSQVYVDDPVGAPGEAGDVVASGVPWASVSPLAAALARPCDPSRPVFLKLVGCSAWDLAACRTARAAMAGRPGGGGM